MTSVWTRFESTSESQSGTTTTTTNAYLSLNSELKYELELVYRALTRLVGSTSGPLVNLAERVSELVEQEREIDQISGTQVAKAEERSEP